MKTAGGGKAKGASFEREVCKRLSLWVTANARDDIFWRSAMSGGRATIQRKVGKINLMQSGDVCAVDPLGYPFVQANFTEIKHVRDLAIARGFVCETGTLMNFWNIARREASRYGKRPLLVARQNLYPTLAITRCADGIFDGLPIIVLHRWDAYVYLFDRVTEVRARLVRRAS